MDNSKTILAKNIRYLMEQKQKTRTELCEALGVKYTTLSDWVNGKTYPLLAFSFTYTATQADGSQVKGSFTDNYYLDE